MQDVMNKIELMSSLVGSSLPHYSGRIFSGIKRAVSEGREMEVSANSILFVNRMFNNRFNKGE